MRPRCAPVVVGLAVLAWTAAAEAAPAQGAESSSVVTFRTTVKATSLVSQSRDTSDPAVERTPTQSLVRFRIEPAIRASKSTTFNLAYEQRLRFQPGSGLAATGILPPESLRPYRIRPLAWRMTESETGAWSHEIDRANAQVHTRRAELTIGRQAIGWGRGVMFTAVDLFAPFSPLEVDREWRAGVDAVRADIKLTERSSIDVVGAFGTATDRSVFAARARGYTGAIDVELIAGRRAGDLFGGVTSSAAVGGAEVHGEAAAFRVVAGTGHDVVWKVVVGGSRRFPVGSGLLVYAEYHYSGFGAVHPEQIRTLLATPAFLERFVRGDVQILSRHVLGILGTYELSPEITYSAQWLHHPRDRSGIVAPALTYTFSDAVSLYGAGYIPYGPKPAGGVLQSEYGSAPFSGLLQLRLYF